MSDQVLTQLHIGLGSFHRAHQAVYMQTLHEQGDTRWQIIGGNIRPDMLDTIAALKAQQGRYTLETVSPAGERHYQQISSIKDVVEYDPELAGLTRVAADPATRIISFTVTEAGYYLDSANNLDESFADLRSDLAGTTHSTIYGALAHLLSARQQAGAGPVTLLNCDNLRSNGSRFYTGFQKFLTQSGQQDLLEWVLANTSAPDAMVDRITPRPTPDVRERVKAATGQDDAAALMGETFIQWVIEDHFIAGRPAWEDAGVEMVEDVMPYEEAKIRLLNATHSCIAWAGTLAGYLYIHEGTLDPEIRAMAFNYVTDDTIPLLLPCPLDLEKYRDVVLDRFGNPAIQDTNQRVAMDAWSKIPGMIAPTIRDRLAQNESIASVAMLPALFLGYLHRWHAGNIPYTYQDQVMDVAAAHAICESSDTVAAYCADKILWGELANDPRLVAGMRAAYARVLSFIQERSA